MVSSLKTTEEYQKVRLSNHLTFISSYLLYN